MGEFLEFIRLQHIKVHGKKRDLMRRIKPRDEQLEYDSMSEITDLSNQDILSSSKQLLTENEKKKLDKYNALFKKVVDSAAPKHNCFAQVSPEKRKKVNNSRFMVQMELRAKSEPKYFDDFENSAHQFSVRSKSI